MIKPRERAVSGEKRGWLDVKVRVSTQDFSSALSASPPRRCLSPHGTSAHVHVFKCEFKNACVGGQKRHIHCKIALSVLSVRYNLLVSAVRLPDFGVCLVVPGCPGEQFRELITFD